MGIVYERLKKLCDDRGISPYRMCKDTGMQPSIMTDLKMDRKHTLSAKSLAKVADYFGVPMNYITGDIDIIPAAYTPSVPNSNNTSYLDLVEDGYVGTAFPTSKGTLTITSDDFNELAELWNTLKDRPEMKMLFKSANSATKAQVEAVVKMLESFNEEYRHEETN